jgi:ubiquinone/menaquinone biosynthesis C-methylase UbiE
MPTIQENKLFWDGSYQWQAGGDEWSRPWGGPKAQWFGTILPRIHAFLPTKTILEIACGYGRWTHYLKDLCTQLIAVDISEECIRACESRFANEPAISFHLNDGKTLDMAADHSVDFIFSMDSLVHADEVVLKAYMKELSRILTRDGVVFLHHSNLGQYSSLLNIARKLRIQATLVRLRLMEENIGWREQNVDAKKVEMYAEEFGMQCISQETITWLTKRTLNDCLSIITRKDSVFARKNQVIQNYSFGDEVARISRLYSFKERNF